MRLRLWLLENFADVAFFETVKNYLQQNVPVQLLDVLRAMFGELMVLGFIALFT